MTINVDGVTCGVCKVRMKRDWSSGVNEGDKVKYYAHYYCRKCLDDVTLFRVVDFARIEKNIKVRHFE